MRRNARCPRPEVLIPRRGNSIVLVMGILVLLVIIATAFITRTHAGRVTSSVMLRTMLRDDNARAMAEMLAQEISMALFPRPVDQTITPPGILATSNTPRLSPLRNPLRYGADQDVVDNSTGVPPSDDLPDHPYNFAPYHVVPFTNWPDEPPGTLNPQWPQGPGSPDGLINLPLPPPFDMILIGAGNPVGNPGFGDTRWLADHEPLRWAIDPGLDGIFGTDDDVQAFSHWRHMTNIAHPNNGFRICRDISDVNGAGLVTDLSIPVAQWLAILPFNLNLATGDSVYPDNYLTGDFIQQWFNWFSPTYQTMYWNNTGGDPLNVPANFYNLSDLNANNNPLEQGERPQDEFIGPSPVWPDGTPRWNVNRVLVDTDGDGFTDSFWYLAPTMTERGIRQIVAVRIIDNSAMLNANVATRFIRNDTGVSVDEKTAGQTPADLALVGQLLEIPPGDPVPPNWNVGLFDNPANHERDLSLGLYNNTNIGYKPEMWAEAETPATNAERSLNYLTEIGVQDQAIPANPNPNFPNQLTTQAERLLYWRAAGLRPFGALAGMTPFSLVDELELRMFQGQNYPWIASRFERAVQAQVLNGQGSQFLHANLGREESSEYLEQLTNVELVFDHRRKLTLYSGARNDQMPPWLWLFAPNTDLDSDGDVDGDDFALFLAGARKFDLRLPPTDFNGDGTVDSDDVVILGAIIRDRLERALVDVADESYYGDGGVNLNRTRGLAAAFTANILAYRDDDADAPLAEAVAVDPAFGPTFPRYLGLERQPFLLEAFIGHVHASEEIDEILPPPPDPPQYFGYPGNYVDDSHEQSTIVVVQIANPFDEPLDLSRYKLRVFDQVIDLTGMVLQLPAASEENPATAIFYAIDEAFEHDSLGLITDFGADWRNFLDIEPGDHPTGPGGTIFVNVTAQLSTNRNDYWSVPAGQNAIELLRIDTSLGPLHDVVIDRFDYDESHADHNEFREAIADLAEPPDPFQDTTGIIPQLAGIRIGSDHYWVTWARATRAWGRDFNYDAGDTNTHGIQPKERAPRFILARQRVTTGDDTLFIGDQNATPADDGPDPNCGYCGDSYADADLPDSPWFDKQYTDATGLSRPRKPTFFNMNPVFDLAGNDIYPDFADPTYGYGSYFYGVSYPPGLEPGAGIPDKGFYHLSNSLQMLQKDGDFEQVGEVLSVWLFGHELGFVETAPGIFEYEETTETFSEYMSDASMVGTGARVNRLRVRPTSIGGNTSPINKVIGVGDPGDLLDARHAVPALPAGLRVLDGFVCDGGGINPGDVDGDGTPNTPNDIALAQFLNANGYSGKITPGLININTAPPEVMRSAPHMARLIHEDNPPVDNPFVRVPEAIVQYRERLGDPTVPSTDFTPVYGDRGDDTFIKDLRGERGIASIGEIMLLNRLADGSPPGEPDPDLYQRSFRADFAGRDPFGFEFAGQPIESTQISTDVIDVFDQGTGQFEADDVAKDAEELNLLFGGMSNMLTTRSDVFTVYFRVRSFIQNPTTRVWDATNPEFIVDDSRYVMLVDRSEVNHPNDKPKILYLEKLPK